MHKSETWRRRDTQKTEMSCLVSFFFDFHFEVVRLSTFFYHCVRTAATTGPAEAGTGTGRPLRYTRVMDAGELPLLGLLVPLCGDCGGL